MKYLKAILIINFHKIINALVFSENAFIFIVSFSFLILWIIT